MSYAFPSVLHDFQTSLAALETRSRLCSVLCLCSGVSLCRVKNSWSAEPTWFKQKVKDMGLIICNPSVKVFLCVSWVEAKQTQKKHGQKFLFCHASNQWMVQPCCIARPPGIYRSSPVSISCTNSVFGNWFLNEVSIEYLEKLKLLFQLFLLVPYLSSRS